MKLAGFITVVAVLLFGCLQPGFAQESPKPGLGNGSGSGSETEQPTPEQLESMYLQIWSMVAHNYHPVERLGDWGAWKERFKGRLTTEAEMDQAITEMVASIGNPYTSYTSLAEIKAAMEAAHQGRTGIGLHLKRGGDGQYRVSFLVWNSPARRSDLRHGAAVVSIAGKRLSMLTQAQVEALLVGNIGTKIEIVYFDGSKEVAIELTFAAIPQPTIEARLLPGDIGYVRVPTWDSKAMIRGTVQAVAHLFRLSGGNLVGLILDQRGNPGGDFDIAVQASSLFIERGPLVTDVWREGALIHRETHEVQATPAFIERDLSPEQKQLWEIIERKPLVVLTDGSTASAAEIVSGALRDSGRARLVGERTFGKGVGYSVWRLSNGGLLRVTNRTFSTPSGIDVATTGVPPHKVVAQPRGVGDGQLAAAVTELREMIAKK